MDIYEYSAERLRDYIKNDKMKLGHYNVMPQAEISIEPKMIMLVGLPASGKSYKAQKLAEEYNAAIFSSDSLREELFGDMNDQEHNTEVFAELHRRIKECLVFGKSAIYDACNTSYKRRMGFLQELKNIPCEKDCILMATPYDECLRRNNEREREVPERVIKRMYEHFNIPYWYEGWDKIKIEYFFEGNCTYGIYGAPAEWVRRVKNFTQDNSHHTLSLGEHSIKVTDCIQKKHSSYRSEHDTVMRVAGVLHDNGKCFVKNFKDSKGNPSNEAHYYNHQYVGAYRSLFYMYSCNPLDVAIRVMWHMQPYFNKEQKTINKYRRLWGEELYNDIMFIHEADVAAH